MSTPITFILPCAGQGTRLDLPYPKELHSIGPGVSLIDFSLHHVKSNIERTEKVVIVLSPGKEMVATYVKTQIPKDICLEIAYFNNEYSELPGSIRSAEAYFGERNVALLPDSVLTPIGSEILSTKFNEAFETGADLVFAYVAETDRSRLANFGALHVDGTRVLNFRDKPQADNPEIFNAFWTAFGFRQGPRAEILDFMMKSVAGEDVNLKSLGLKIAAFPVADYVDLGTWPSIMNYLSAKNLRG